MYIYDVLNNTHEHINTIKKRIFHFWDYPPNMIINMDNVTYLRLAVSLNEVKLTNRVLDRSNLALQLLSVRRYVTFYNICIRI